MVSILSNGGLQAAVEAAGGEVVRTPVGDKYILEGMQVSGATLGGEKSGHVIVLEHTTSGDGIVTALEVLRVMVRRGKRALAELAADDPAPATAAARRARPVTRTSGRAIRSSGGRSPRRPHDWRARAACSSGRPAPSPRCGSWSKATDAALVAELADSLAALAGERLH